MENIVIIGGGNMAAAIIGGLHKNGRPGSSIIVVDPGEAQRARLGSVFGVRTLGAADTSLNGAALVVWAVKPQVFREAAVPCVPFIANALHLSVMAGIRTDSIAATAGTDRVVRAMPNTPALVGKGMTGLFARPSVSAEEQRFIEAVLSATGRLMWLGHEADLDVVTALSGSGPAYVFFFIESMITAALEMGLTAEQGRTLALATFAGATELAIDSADAVSTLRERVTSKGGTTYAAITSLQGTRSARFSSRRYRQRSVGPENSAMSSEPETRLLEPNGSLNGRAAKARAATGPDRRTPRRLLPRHRGSGLP